MPSQATIQRLNELCDKYEEALKSVKPSDHNSPINREVSKKEFASAIAEGRIYNPQFIYQPVLDDWEKPFVELQRDIDPFANPWEQLLYQDVRRNILELEAIRTHDPDKITAESIHSYGLPTDELVREAQKVLISTTVTDEIRDIPAASAAAFLKECLLEAGLSNWSVLLKQPMNARMMVRAIEKQVYIREDAYFSQESIRRLLVHEIGTHVFRSVNGEQQQLRLLKLGLIGYLGTEEGLATYHEEKFGVQDGATLRRYALRVIAASKSLTSSFHDIVLLLSEYTSDIDEIFDIATRAKRGFLETEHTGGHVKDHVYLKGYMDISSHLAEYPEDYEFLMCGKIALSMIGVLQQLDDEHVLVRPQFLPEHLIHPS